MGLEGVFAMAAGILISGAVLLVGLGLYILFFTNELDDTLGYDNEVGGNDEA